MTASIPSNSTERHNDSPERQNNGSKRSNRSFRQQLVIMFAVAGLLAGVAAATAYWYSTSEYIRELYEKQALRATENFAQLSELALLYESGENAAAAAAVTLSFPSIKYVSITTSDDKLLLEEGSWNGEKLAVKAVLEQSTLQETVTAWHYWAPVFTQTVDGIDEGPDDVATVLAPANEYLGYVYVVLDKSEYIATENAIFRENLLIGGVCGIGFLLIMLFALDRLLSPMNKLVGVMDRTRRGDTDARAIPYGPIEFVDMADIYNNVMDNLADRDKKLMQQTDFLETEVELRTQELVHARDAALDASRHKSEFLANMSHELRTPLQAIIGYSDIMMESAEDEGMDELCEDVERITDNANHLLGLINGILDLSKIEAGRMDVQLSHVKIGNVIEKACQTITPLMRKNVNELLVDNDAPDTIVEIDETKLLQILLNLLSNAGKFTENGKVSVHVDHRPDQLTLIISDTGIGMNGTQMGIIFDPFRQVDGSTTREFEGTGLGLSITRRFVEVMGGSISVTSKEGDGSNFMVRFPLPIVGLSLPENSSANDDSHHAA